jgi:hypothetical protein
LSDAGGSITFSEVKSGDVGMDDLGEDVSLIILYTIIVKLIKFVGFKILLIGDPRHIYVHVPSQDLDFYLHMLWFSLFLMI